MDGPESQDPARGSCYLYQAKLTDQAVDAGLVCFSPATRSITG